MLKTYQEFVSKEDTLNLAKGWQHNINYLKPGINFALLAREIKMYMASSGLMTCEQRIIILTK